MLRLQVALFHNSVSSSFGGLPLRLPGFPSVVTACAWLNQVKRRVRNQNLTEVPSELVRFTSNVALSPLLSHLMRLWI
jgi:hypothetical protein